LKKKIIISWIIKGLKNVKLKNNGRLTTKQNKKDKKLKKFTLKKEKKNQVNPGEHFKSTLTSKTHNL
jgi:hypothetical protein